MQVQKSIRVEVKERKRKYEDDKKNPAINKAVWNAKQRKWVHPFTQRSNIQPAVREVFKDLTDEPSDSKDSAKFVSRCLEKLYRGEFNLEENFCKNKYRVMDAGPPKNREVRYALFGYFIDIRYNLRGRLPQYILLSKAKQPYEEHCFLKAKAGEEPKKLKITRKRLNYTKITRKWCKDYRIYLKYPNKRFL